jgi:hypothetical protein
LPGEKKAERKCARQDWKRIEEVKIDFWDNERTIEEKTELYKSEDCTNLILALNSEWIYELTWYVDVQGDEDPINDTNPLLRLRNTFFVVAIAVAEVERNKTEPRER